MNTSIAKHARAQAVVEDLSLTSLVEKALIDYLPQETVIKKVEIKSETERRAYLIAEKIKMEDK